MQKAMLEHKTQEISKSLAKRVDKPKKNACTEKEFRESAETQLAEADISIVGFCEVGTVKSTKIAREHAEYSTMSIEIRMSMIDGKKR